MANHKEELTACIKNYGYGISGIVEQQSYQVEKLIDVIAGLVQLLYDKKVIDTVDIDNYI